MYTNGVIQVRTSMHVLNQTNILHTWCLRRRFNVYNIGLVAQLESFDLPKLRDIDLWMHTYLYNIYIVHCIHVHNDISETEHKLPLCQRGTRVWQCRLANMRHVFTLTPTINLRFVRLFVHSFTHSFIHSFSQSFLFVLLLCVLCLIFLSIFCTLCCLLTLVLYVVCVLFSNGE